MPKWDYQAFSGALRCAGARGEERNVTEPGSGTGQEPDCTRWVTVQDAATVLSISERAVWKRVKAGTLARRQEGRRVLVQVLDTEPDTVPVQELEAEQKPEVQEPTELVAELRQQVEFLKGRVVAHERAEGELRQLMLADKHELQRLRQQLAIAAAPAEAAPPDAAANQGASEKQSEVGQARPWWKKLFMKGKE